MGQRQIWIVAATAFACLCAAGVVASVWRDRLATRDLIVRDTVARVDQVAAHAEQGLGNAVTSLRRAGEVLAPLDPAGITDVEPYRTRLDDLVVGNTAVGTLWATTADGTTWVNNNSSNRLSSDIRDRAYYKAVSKQPDALYVGPSELGTVVKRQRFPIATGIRGADGEFRGVVVAGIDQAFLLDIYRQATRDRAVALIALNSLGDILAIEPDAPDAVKSIARGLLSSATDHSLSEVDGWLFAVRRLQSVPVMLVGANDLSVAYGDWYSRSVRAALLGVMVILFFLLLTLQGLRAVGREEAARQGLRQANETLEARVRERTKTVELLFRELNHRVKNNLQIIASLLRLQIRKSSDPDVKAVLQDSVNRVFAIADVHGELEGGRDGTVPLQAYVGKIVSRICDAMQKPGQAVDVRLTIDDAELPIDRAVLVAIAINETVTNAFKHAFARRDTGTLEITVRAADEMIHLVVRNDVAEGDGPDQETRRSGLGSSIVEMLVQQMAGSLAIDRDDGYSVRITVPLSEQRQ